MSVSTRSQLSFSHLPLSRPSIVVLALASATCLPVHAEPSDPVLAPEFLAIDGEPSMLPEVLTTTRLRQSKLKVPGTTTILTGDMIRDLGIMNLVEALRLVPGMVVGHRGSTNPVATYHGTSQYEQRRLQVLIDGRTAYRASLADVEWIAMPVALENIERIEVSRGPNSAAYGINAFLGTVNIITRSPDDTGGVEAYAASGSRGYLRTFTSVGDANPFDGSWRLSYEKRKSNGFDTQVEGGEAIPFHDGHDVNNFNFDSILRIDNQHSVDFRAGVLEGVNEEDRYKSGKLQPVNNPDILMDDYYLQVRFNGGTSPGHFYHVQASYQNQKRRQRWTVSFPAEQFVALLPPDNPFPTDQGPFVADLNEDREESRQEFELQDTLIVNPQLKLVSGIGYRKDTFESETFFNGRGNNYQSRVFANAEYSPLHWLTFNAGGNYEKTTTTHEGYFSPRAATNLIFNDNHALRFVFSRAVRTPDAFEQEPDWSYRPANVQAPFSALEGVRFLIEDLVDPRTSTYGEELEEEWITSREISYFGQFHLDKAMFSLEVRYFNDDLRDMISGVINEEEWTIDNNVDLDQEGFEIETSLELSGTMLRATYGYLDQDGRYIGDTTNLSESDQQYAVDLLGRLSAQHSGSFAWIQDLPRDLTSSAAFYWTNEVRNTRFERADFRLAKRVDTLNYSYVLALTVQHYLNPKAWISPDNRIEDHNQFFVEAGIRF